MRPVPSTLYSQTKIDALVYIIGKPSADDIDWKHPSIVSYGVEKGDPNYYVKLREEDYATSEQVCNQLTDSLFSQLYSSA